MATLLTEDFEGGSNGVTITGGNSQFTASSGTPTFDSSISLVGSQSMLANPSAATEYVQHQAGALRATSGARFYFRCAALPAAVTYISSFNALPSTVRAQIGVNTNGTVRIRNATTLTATTTAALSTDTWYRFEWVLDNTAGTQDLRIFDGHDASAISGADISGTYNVGTHEDFFIGVVQSATWTVNFDAARLDDTATFVGPAVAAEEPRRPSVFVGPSQAVHRAANW